MRAFNIDRFEPGELERWRLIAAGQRPVRAGKRNESRWYALTDSEGYVVRNGGIAMARPWDMPAGHYYYRFIDSSRYTGNVLAGPRSETVFGGWWIEYEVTKTMVNFARAHGDPLEAVASYFLALPAEWGDRGWMIRAYLKFPLRAWRGRGRSAESSSGKYIPPQHLKEVFQLFIPGNASQRSAAFLPVQHKQDVIRTSSFDSGSWFK